MPDVIRETLLANIYNAAIETPLQLAAKVSARTDNEIFLKREDMQPVHSFKIRGAYNKISAISREIRAKGVMAASAGNHAQGVALSAMKLGIEASVVMPRTTPEIKIEAVKSYGAEVILSGDSYTEAYEHCMQILKGSNRTFIHPFDDRAVIIGQGTIGRELIAQLPDTDYIFVPVGGGGLIAGIAQYVKAISPHTRIIGVEPDDSNAMQASLSEGQRVVLPHVGLFADGVAVKQVGSLTFRICQQFVDSIITVNNDQICAAIKQIFEETRSIVEPAGALSLAGAVQYTQTHKLQGKKIVTICSGANLTFEKLQFVAEHTLIGSGKVALFAVRLPEQPGALARFCDVIIHSHNITTFAYRLQSREEASILLGINVSSESDRQKFKHTMDVHGFGHQDLSDDDLAKEHVRHMVGGQGAQTRHEHLYTINFPERPKALADFLAALGNDFNISLFHYRGQGGDIGSVLIGFEAEDVTKLENILARTGFDFEPASSWATRILLS